MFPVIHGILAQGRKRGAVVLEIEPINEIIKSHGAKLLSGTVEYLPVVDVGEYGHETIVSHGARLISGTVEYI